MAGKKKRRPEAALVRGDDGRLKAAPSCRHSCERGLRFISAQPNIQGFIEA